MRQNDLPVVYGVTGGVGSGKSTVLKYVASHYQARIILADEVGRELMQPGKCLYEALVAHYGTGILLPDGAIDRQKLSEIGFSTKESQEELNRIEHGIIAEEIDRRIRRTRKPVVFLEAALLKEGNLVEKCEEVIYIHANVAARLERLISLRGYTIEKSMMFMDLQLTEEEFRSFCTYEIDNSGPFTETVPKIRMLMKELDVPEIVRKES